MDVEAFKVVVHALLRTEHPHMAVNTSPVLKLLSAYIHEGVFLPKCSSKK